MLRAAGGGGLSGPPISSTHTPASQFAVAVGHLRSPAAGRDDPPAPFDGTTGCPARRYRDTVVSLKQVAAANVLRVGDFFATCQRAETG